MTGRDVDMSVLSASSDDDDDDAKSHKVTRQPRVSTECHPDLLMMGMSNNLDESLSDLFDLSDDKDDYDLIDFYCMILEEKKI